MSLQRTIQLTAIVRYLAFFLWMTVITSARATTPESGYLTELQQRAHALKLAQREEWRQLLHFKVHPLTRLDRSLADDPDFFNSPEGSTNAAAELDATLGAFFDTNTQRSLGQIASCRFVARYQWLKSELQFDPLRLPPPDCSRYQQWRAGINASSATLVFPAAYLNSPASMYGHTFLRLDPPSQPGKPSSPLLSYAINYAANGHESDGLAFAFKGLTGLYAGQFTNAPYYLRIREYNDLENRDIWEYELSFTQAEMDRLLAHVWEVGPTRFDYYFFDENCSYHLLALLDVARPGMGLSDQFVWRAIPVDTVKAVSAVPGLLKAVHYRPSNSTELLARAQRLKPDQIRFAKALSTGDAAIDSLAIRSEAHDDQARMLEVAERYTALEATQKAIGHDAVEKRRRELLGTRANLPALPSQVITTPAVAPHEGHDSARWDVMLGRREGRAVWQVSARPAYHDLTDTEDGYQRGAGIQFLKLELSKAEQGAVQLERLTFVDITSLSPYDPLLQSKSWRVRAAITRRAQQGAESPHHTPKRPLFWDIGGGPGLSMELSPSQKLLGYAMVDNQIWVNLNTPSKHSSVGSGFALGLVLDSDNRRLRLLPELFGHVHLGATSYDYGGRLDARYRLNHHQNIKVQCEWKREQPRVTARSCLMGLNQYW